MNLDLNHLLALFGSFILGSIPFGSLISKLYGIDIKKTGSGNTGASNVARSVGKIPGILTLFLDCAKGALPVFFAAPGIDQITNGLFAVLGHCYSPFLNFNGGKGVATALGVFLLYSGKFCVGEFGFIGLITFIIAFLKWRYVSLASIAAASLIILFGWYLFIISSITFLEAVIVSIIGGIVTYRHRANIERISAGTESVFKLKK